MYPEKKIINFSLVLFLIFSVSVDCKICQRACFFVGIAPSVLFLLARKDRPAWLKDPLIILIFVFIAYLSLNSFFVSDGNIEGKIKQARWGLEILVLVCATIVASEFWLSRPFFYGRIFLAMVAAGALLAMGFNFPAAGFSGRLSGFGFLHNPIQGASVLLVLWCIGFFLVTRDRKPDNVDILSMFFSVSVLLIYTVLSQSRGPLFSLFIIIILSIFLLNKSISNKLNSKKHIFAAALFGSFFALIFFCCKMNFEYFKVLIFSRGLSYRPQIWNATLENAETFYLFGIGGATKFVDSPPGKQLFQEFGVSIVHTHNIFLQMFLIGGIVALLMFVLILIKTLSRFFEKSCSESVRSAAIPLFLVVMSVNFVDTVRPIIDPRADWILFWIPLLFLVSVTYWEKNRGSGKNV